MAVSSRTTAAIGAELAVTAPVRAQAPTGAVADAVPMALALLAELRALLGPRFALADLVALLAQRRGVPLRLAALPAQAPMGLSGLLVPLADVDLVLLAPLPPLLQQMTCLRQLAHLLVEDRPCATPAPTPLGLPDLLGSGRSSSAAAAELRAEVLATRLLGQFQRPTRPAARTAAAAGMRQVARARAVVHPLLLQVVPVRPLAVGADRSCQRLRQAVELAAARQVFWSWVPGPLTPAQEVALLAVLVAHGVRLSQPGPERPAAPRHPAAHDRAVARRWMRLASPPAALAFPRRRVGGAGRRRWPRRGWPRQRLEAVDQAFEVLQEVGWHPRGTQGDLQLFPRVRLRRAGQAGQFREEDGWCDLEEGTEHEQRAPARVADLAGAHAREV